MISTHSITRASAVAASLFAAFAVAPLALASVSLVCNAPAPLAIKAKVELSTEDAGGLVTLSVFDNFWHPKALRCSNVEASGAMVSTCAGTWHYLTDAAKYAVSGAALVRSKQGYEVVVTSNTFAKLVTVPCEIADAL